MIATVKEAGAGVVVDGETERSYLLLAMGIVDGTGDVVIVTGAGLNLP